MERCKTCQSEMVNGKCESIIYPTDIEGVIYCVRECPDCGKPLDDHECQRCACGWERWSDSAPISD